MYKRNFFNFFVSKVLAFVLFFSSIVAIAGADPLQAQFFVNSFSANVGDSVDFVLKVNPTADKPVYTVISSLKYDKNLLNFVSSEYQPGWVVVSPEEVTDTKNGIIKRAAGYPTGLKTTGTFIKYSFTATAPGKAVVNIVGGSAYDADSNDYGLQNKTITVTISSKTKTPVTPTETPAKKIIQEVILGFNGAIAATQNQDFNFKLSLLPKDPATTTGRTDISVLDSSKNVVYTQEQAFQSNSTSSLEQNFTIPANTLDPGNYSLLASSSYDNQKSQTTLSKDFGVVAPVEKDVVQEKIVQVVPLWYWAIVILLLATLLFTLAYYKNKKFRKFIKDF